VVLRILFIAWAIFLLAAQLTCGCAGLWQKLFH